MHHDHFVDANVLVGSQIGWDKHHKISLAYVARVERVNIIRHTSVNAFHEARHVFEAIRVIGGDYLDHLSLYKFTAAREEIVSNIVDCKGKYEQTQELSDKEKDRLDSFINDIYVNDSLVKMIEQDTINGVSNFRGKMINATKEAFRLLRKDCNQRDKDPKIDLFERKDPNHPEKEAQYPDVQLALSEIIVDNENDVKLLVDTHHLETLIKKNISFVTFDKTHFFGENEENKRRIEEVLEGIFMQHPTYGLSKI